jgi:hypothetical protein
MNIRATEFREDVIVWNVFDDAMNLRGIYAAELGVEAIRQVADWHSTSRIEGWSAHKAFSLPTTSDGNQK